MEDLKARYYDCCRKLTAGRPAADEQAKNTTMNSYIFDKAREGERKTYLKSLLDRTAEEVAEEQFLYIESRRLEQNFDQTARRREDLLRTLGGPGSGATLQGGMVSGSAPMGAAQPGPRLVGAAAAAAHKASANRAAGAKAAQHASQVPVDPAFDAQHHITRLEAPGQVTLNPFGLPRSGIYSAAAPTVTLRSARMPTVKPALIPKVTEALTEMRISQRLVMPTCSNQERLEALNAAVAQLVELKKQVERAEYEVGVKERTVRGSEQPEGLVPGIVGDAAAVLDESIQRSTNQAHRSASVSSTQSASRPPQKKKRKR